MSLRATPSRDSSWVGNWTTFYRAWWISWSPFVGLFIARVSRGRTIREFIPGTVLAPSLAAFMWFAIFGGTALYMEIWPPARTKLVWGSLIAGIAISLLLAGGLDALQTAAILFALPFALVTC